LACINPASQIIPSVESPAKDFKGIFMLTVIYHDPVANNKIAPSQRCVFLKTA